MAWTIERSRVTGRDYITDKARPYGRRTLATVTGGTREDAAMMAAAPDLLAALLIAREYVRGMLQHSEELDDLHAIDAAIAKAGGGA